MVNLKKLYFGIVSLVSIIVVSVNLGIALANLWKLVLISDEEYLARHSYEIQSCSYRIKTQLCWPNLENCKYDKEEYKNLLSECESQEKKKILLRRHYNLKSGLISAVSGFIVFFIIFLLHYLTFRKQD